MIDVPFSGNYVLGPPGIFGPGTTTIFINQPLYVANLTVTYNTVLCVCHPRVGISTGLNHVWRESYQSHDENMLFQPPTNYQILAFLYLDM